MSGKADTNGDHLVTLGELFPLCAPHVRLDTQYKQNPRMLIGRMMTAISASRANRKVVIDARFQGCADSRVRNGGW